MFSSHLSNLNDSHCSYYDITIRCMIDCDVLNLSIESLKTVITHLLAGDVAI